MSNIKLKFLIILLTSIIMVNCTTKYNFNTEIFCPYQPPTLIKFTSANNLRNSIIRNIRENQSNIVIFKLDDRRRFAFKVKSAQLSECQFVESVVGQVEQNYIHNF